MEDFLNAISQAASSPYAFVAYAIAAIVAIVGGLRQRELSAVMQKIEKVPETDALKAIQTVTQKPLPPNMTSPQWIKLRKQERVYVVAIVLIIVCAALGTISLLA